MQIPKIIFRGLGYPEGFTDKIAEELQKAFDGKIRTIELDGGSYPQKYYYVVVTARASEGNYQEFEPIEEFADKHNWTRKWIEVKPDADRRWDWLLQITFEVHKSTTK